MLKTQRPLSGLLGTQVRTHGRMTHHFLVVHPTNCVWPSGIALSLSVASGSARQGSHFQSRPRAGRSERGRTLVGDGESAFQGDADAAERAFLEEATD